MPHHDQYTFLLLEMSVIFEWHLGKIYLVGSNFKLLAVLSLYQVFFLHFNISFYLLFFWKFRSGFSKSSNLDGIDEKKTL